MSACSVERAAGLAAVTPKQILSLLEILQSTTWRSISFIANLYNERAPNFAGTLAFLEELGWVRRSGEKLNAAPWPLSRLAHAPPGEKAPALAEALLDSPGAHQKTLADYLARFALRDGQLEYCPQGDQRLEYSPVRDFLMELGAISYSPGSDLYVLTNDFAALYVSARNLRGPAGEAALAQSSEDRHRLGHTAELLVVAFERERLGPHWGSHVRHVADEFPAASYDIKSLTVAGEFVSPRFIEVKAVPATSLQFYWTSLELEAARLLGANFFLYLLPVVGSAAFDIDRLEIVQNPYVSIYQNPSVWLKDQNVIVCRRR